MHLDVSWRLQGCVGKTNRDRAVESLLNLLLLLVFEGYALLKGLCGVFGDLVDRWACELARWDPVAFLLWRRALSSCLALLRDVVRL